MTIGGSDDFRPLNHYLRAFQKQRLRGHDGSISSGLVDLDKITGGGFQRSDLIVLAARPSMGRTSLVLGIVANAGLRFQSASAVFSLEMSAEQLAARLLATESGVETTRLRSGQLTEAESRKLGHVLGMLADTQIYVDDTPGLSVCGLRAKIGRLHAEVPLDLIVIDHIQQLTDREGGQGSAPKAVDVGRSLKQLARELTVPVLAISDLPDAVERRTSKVPVLSDLDEYGSLREAADVVMFLYRDDYYNKDSERQGIAEIHVAKHRNGPTGQISLLFNQRTTRFFDLEVYHETAADIDD